MKVVCICDAGVPEMLMQYMKKLPGCDVTLHTEKTLTDIRSLTMCERTAELHGAEACSVSAEMLEAVMIFPYQLFLRRKCLKKILSMFRCRWI